MLNMFITAAFIIGILGQLSNGVPLEESSSHFAQFFGSRIVGGAEAPKGSAPHMVALVVGHTSKSFVCGGSIITHKYMLSAAHCVTGLINWNGELIESFHARVGSNVWHKGIVVELKGYINHPEYDQPRIKNDIAFLIADNNIQMSKDVAPIKLSIKKLDGGEKSFVTGWGTDRLLGAVPDNLQILFVHILAYEKCKALAKEIGALWGGLMYEIDPFLEICTLHRYGGGGIHS